MKKLTAGIVGLGYVGGAIYNAIPDAETYDKNSDIKATCNSIAQLVDRVELVYVCVPTPATKYGECDTSIVVSVVDEIVHTATSTKIIVIKSTVPPGTTAKLQEKHKNHHILFSPEFLTEANYKTDYLNQSMMLVGYSGEDHRYSASKVLEHQILHVEEIGFASILDATTAELYKYVANNFLATKVSFANEMYNVARKLNVSWNDVAQLAKYDSRLGKSHWMVPGPDGHFGFGGTCLPKDLSAMIQFAQSLGVSVPVLTTVELRNMRVDRPERDWQKLKGRAVSE
jgi:UDPglucose 6-dehydrogenase